VQLPRYHSKALPEQSFISPGQAGAGDAALGYAVAGGLDVVAQISDRIRQAEAEVAANAALAETEARITGFLKDPRWQQTEIGGERVEVVQQREWEKFSARLLAAKPVIHDRDFNNQFGAKRKELLQTAGVELAGQQRKMLVARGRVAAVQAGRTYEQAGNYEAAREQYRSSAALGLHTLAEADALIQKATVEEISSGFLGEIAEGSFGTDFDTLGERILNDERLPAPKRQALYASLNTKYDREERALDKQQKKVWSLNAVSVWNGILRGDVNAAAIMRSNVDPEDKPAMLRLFYDNATSPNGTSTPEALRAANQAIVDFHDGKTSKAEARDAILARTDLDPKKKVEAMNMVETVSNGVIGGAAESAAKQAMSRLITGGYPIDKMVDVMGEGASQLVALDAEWNWKFMVAQMEQGGDFDPRGWVMDHREEIEAQAKAVATPDRFRGVTKAETKANIDKSVEQGLTPETERANLYRKYDITE